MRSSSGPESFAWYLLQQSTGLLQPSGGLSGWPQGQGFRAAGGHATEGSRVDACVGHLYDQNFAHTHITLHRCRLEGVNTVLVHLASQELTQKAMRKQR